MSLISMSRFPFADGWGEINSPSVSLIMRETETAINGVRPVLFGGKILLLVRPDG
jgi:hypothetical protein